MKTKDSLKLAGWYVATYGMISVIYAIQGIYEAMAVVKTLTAQRAHEHAIKMIKEEGIEVSPIPVVPPQDGSLN